MSLESDKFIRQSSMLPLFARIDLLCFSSLRLLGTLEIGIHRFGVPFFIFDLFLSTAWILYDCDLMSGRYRRSVAIRSCVGLSSASIVVATMIATMDGHSPETASTTMRPLGDICFYCETYPFRFIWVIVSLSLVIGLLDDNIRNSQ